MNIDEAKKVQAELKREYDEIEEENKALDRKLYDIKLKEIDLAHIKDKKVRKAYLEEISKDYEEVRIEKEKLDEKMKALNEKINKFLKEA